jgi:xanthine dehydrogenase small subunit
MHHPVLQFVHRGEIISLRNVPPTRSLLQVLREDLACTDSKEGCNEGDCGACTVVLGERQHDHIHYSAINSCIRLAHSIHGMALWTAQDLAAADGTPHPVQQALSECHASQCGFCTPGIAMSLFGLYQKQAGQNTPLERTQAAEVLTGNLCRCTGYRPILDAAQRMGELPRVMLDETKVLQQLELLTLTAQALEADLSYNSPDTLNALLAARSAQPKAQLVAGCTDVGLWVNKQHRHFEQVIDLTRVAELRGIDDLGEQLQLGAAVRLTDAFAALEHERPQLHSFFSRFAAQPVRNSGTLGGNIANGSPIGDAMPLLIALHARVVLSSVRGQRELALEDFYTGYRQNVLAADEVLAWIKVPKPAPDELLRAYKISKRFDDDISAVCLCLNVQLQNGYVTQASIGVGGVAATPMRASQTEAQLLGQAWNQTTVTQASDCLRQEFSPISDMRASSQYRSQVLGNLLQRFWRESQGETLTQLADVSMLGDWP